ncbi:MAG: hypothetical protein JXR40_12280 [Pontiellaceae bacterium]|nr:hypothetical protein [Pontiellaceae bacterium]
MDIEIRSFAFGTFFGIGVMLMLQIIFNLLRPWVYANMCGVPVSLWYMLGIKLRSSPPRLLIDAYVILKKISVEVTLEHVEWVYIQNKRSADNAEKLARLAHEQLKKQQAEDAM